jgi:hypothetical protein
MDTTWPSVLWSQFGAAIDMLDNAIVVCPDELWGDRTQNPEYWYTAYHALFWLDLYLTGSVQGFAPPAPFNLDELDPAGLLPARVYTQAEMQAYLQHCRQKCQAILAALTDDQARRLCPFSWGPSFAELLLYNMRHVQEHAAQLSLILGQKYGSGPGWVAQATNK